MTKRGGRRRTGRKRKTNDEERRKKNRKDFVCWLVAYRPSNRLVYLRDGSAQTILRAATLR